MTVPLLALAAVGLAHRRELAVFSRAIRKYDGPDGEVTEIDESWLPEINAAGKWLAVIGACAFIGGGGALGLAIMGGRTASPSTDVAGFIFQNGFESCSDPGSSIPVSEGFYDQYGVVGFNTNNPRTGSCSAEFVFPAHTGSEQIRELRLRVNNDTYREIWLEWYNFYPSNYKYQPGVSEVSRSKWNIIIPAQTCRGGEDADYLMHPGSALSADCAGEWHARIEKDDPNPASDTTTYVDGNGWVAWGCQGAAFTSDVVSGCGSFDTSGSFTGSIPKTLRNTWVRERIHFMPADSIAAANGIWEYCVNDTQVMSHNNTTIGGKTGTTPLPPEFFEFWGSQVDGYVQETTFYIDDVTVYGSSPGWDVCS